MTPNRNLILAIESSCDETSVAILEQSGELVDYQSYYDYINNFKVLANIISSQIQVYADYGGVIPEIGARQHAKNIFTVFEEALGKANLDHQTLFSRLKEIKVTTNPGLLSALRVGLEFAKVIQFYCYQETGFLPEIKEINHLHGHVNSSFFNNLNSDFDSTANNFSDRQIFPHLHLLVSGGNSQIILMKKPGQQEIVGQTLDDAAGESLDKIGRMLGLLYPGGVWVSKIAGLVDENYTNFPIGMSKNKELNFSFSGLKTAVRYFVEKQKFAEWKFEQKLTPEELETVMNLPRPELQDLSGNPSLDYLWLIKKVCISSQSVVTEQLLKKFQLAVKKYSPNSIGLSGGVSANELLRKKMSERFNLPIFIPDKRLTGDNAVMIGLS